MQSQVKCAAETKKREASMVDPPRAAAQARLGPGEFAHAGRAGVKTKDVLVTARRDQGAGYLSCGLDGLLGGSSRSRGAVGAAPKGDANLVLVLVLLKRRMDNQTKQNNSCKTGYPSHSLGHS